MLVDKLTSQPLAALLSQLPKPPLQLTPQTPPVQVLVAFDTCVGHALPQAPQFCRLVKVLTSQPLAVLLSQLANPELQIRLQLPFAQVAVPFTPAHTCPQAPQLLR